MIVVACDSAEPSATTGADGAPSTTAGETPGTTGEGGEGGEGGALDTYTMGIFEDVTTDNPWSYLDSSGSDVWVGYVLGPTLGAPYTINYPGLEPVPDMAAGELEPVVQEGDTWVGTITLRDDLIWSDGEPVTANDYVFTFETARDFGLTANWPDYLDAGTADAPGPVTAVEAVDDQTIQFTFNAQPGLAIWGVGNGPPFMPVLPEHFWGPVVEEAAATATPRDTLIAASGVGAPSAGPTVFGEIQEGSFAASTANENYYDTGKEVTSGGVTYSIGPFAGDFNYPLYGGQEAAVLALAEGEVDLLLNPLGMQRGLRDQVEGNQELTAVVNPTNGYRFLAFNHARAPMSDPAFRDALTAMINKEYVTENLLQGAAFPLYVLLPEGNEAWYNADAAAEMAESGFADLDDDTRRATAIGMLTGAGYTWPEGQAPGWYDEAGAYSAEPAEGFTYTAAAGDIIGPDGNPVQPLELMHPNAGYDPLRATFGGYIAGVAREIGIPLSSVPTDFGKIIDVVFEFDEATATYTSPYDMFILGYSLGNPVFPTFHRSFFATGGDSNNTQYSNAEFDELANAFDAAATTEEAYDIMWQLEQLIARDKPHVPLFDTGILEFYNNRVEFPFTETLSGLQFLNGSPGTVAAR
ncbi:MAG TPA: ABC transporter substrate-binding protein [Acidimicrobiia bacterium]|nr:ABC transporter substrate-binding protein [Acidimicrobiia bacterium]